MYRRFLVECSGCYEHEKEFCDTYIQSDNKNIHSWTYRKWIVDTFGLFDGELEYTESKHISFISLLEYIKIDIFNNSAWSYRFYVYSHLHPTSQNLDKELGFVLSKLDEAPHNEAAWNYLYGYE
ncbi:hypothetical protein WA538_006043 [Blastocystis sp. DL]